VALRAPEEDGEWGDMRERVFVRQLQLNPNGASGAADATDKSLFDAGAAAALAVGRAHSPAAHVALRNAAAAEVAAFIQANPCRGRLVVVPGHAVFRGRDPAQWRDEAQWALEPFQRGHGLPDTIAAHIRAAVAAAIAPVTAKSAGGGDTQAETSLLVFSGGQSRPGLGTRSEGASYLDILMADPHAFGSAAQMAQLLEPLVDGSTAGGQPRIAVEGFARDSYENLLFSICRYYEVVGAFPREIVVVGYEYKRARFEAWHRAALRWPLSRFVYLGRGDAPAGVRKDTAGSPAPPLSDAVTLAETERDPYRCGVFSTSTRRKRNPNRLTAPYYSSVPRSVVRLMLHCGPSLFDLPLPWSPS
jgi:hypothetical protein